MAPKQTRALTKAKELQAADTPLVRILKNIKNGKVQKYNEQLMEGLRFLSAVFFLKFNRGQFIQCCFYYFR